MFMLVVVNGGSACATGGVANHTLPPDPIRVLAQHGLENYFIEWYLIF